MKVLIVGHSCSAVLGSEPSSTWNWAWEMAKRHEVWVIAHPEFRHDVNHFLGSSGNERLHFVWISPPNFLDPWRPSRGEGMIRIHYLLWLRFALAEAKRLHARVGFDLCHHVSWGTVGVPSPFGALRIPLIWGPIGGGQTAPRGFGSIYGKGWMRQRFRDLRVHFLKYSPFLHRTVRSASLVLTTNRDTEAIVRESGGQARMFLDCGLPRSFFEPLPASNPPSRTLRILWAGRLAGRKGLPLLLAALRDCPELPAQLSIAGDGPLKSEWERLVREFDLETKVCFLGRVDYSEMARLFRAHDVFVFTSLCDSFGSVVLEAMAHGLPVVTLDHHGVGAFVPLEAGVKVPVTTPAETIHALGAGLRDLAASRRRLDQMGLAARRFAESQMWERRADEMRGLYDEVVRSRATSKAATPGLIGALFAAPDRGSVEPK